MGKKTKQWKLVMPNYDSYPFPRANQEPIYVYQEGLILYIKSKDSTYVVELTPKQSRG